MTIKTVVLYSEHNDPMVEVLRHASRVDIIHVDECTPHLQRADWPRTIRARFPDSLKHRFDGALVFNRLFSPGETMLARTLEEWKYHAMWGHLALSPLLDLAAGLAHDRGVRGVSRSMLPLNTQWWMLQSREAGIGIPRFVYHFGTTMPDLHAFTDPMRKSIWSLADWKEEHHFAFSEDIWHPFFVERPQGTPVICNFINDDIGWVFPRGRIDVDRSAYEHLASNVRDAFRSHVGEFLTYVTEDGSIRFYAFTPVLMASLKDSSFTTRLLEFIHGAADRQVWSWRPRRMAA